MLRMRRALLAGLLAMALSACATAPSPATHRYSGTWDWHFETSSFTTDDAEGPWWLHAEGEAWEQLNAPFRRAGEAPWGRLHVVVEGELSPPGHYGHMAAYDRELRVTRVIEATPIAGGP
jgi:hypothetical protein